MKRQIRRGVFETNSSSTHAICISKNNNYEKCDHINFEPGDFGWEFEKYDDLYSKASYLITAILDRNIEYADEKLEQLKELLERNNIEYTFPNPEIKSYECGDNGEKEYYYDVDGYIDHIGGTEEFVNAVLSDDEIFMRYMFGDSFIVTGNDNDNEPFFDYMYEDDGIEHTDYGDYKRYGGLKKEFDNYDIYEKWN